MSSLTPSYSGIGAGSTQGVPLVVILCFISISLYNFLELNLIIYSTFKRKSGLYFWSFVISTWGVAIWSLGWLMKTTGITSWMGPNNYLLYMAFVEVGFVCMVTGQGFVLYSRLHIVVRSHKKLRLCLWMVICDGIICHVPIWILAYGTNSPNPGPFLIPYAIYMKIQVTIFFLQELVLSAIYIHETLKMMRTERRSGVAVTKGGSRKLMKHLILVNIVVIALDITILGLEYSGYYSVQTAYKGMVYSIKLKMEFSILNRLVEMVGGTASASSGGTRGLPSIATRSRAGPTDRSCAGGIPMDDMHDGAMSPRDVKGESHIQIQKSGEEYGDVGLGYNAFAHGGDRNDVELGDRRAMGAGGLGGSHVQGITRTTEVRVHHDEFLDDSSGSSVALEDHVARDVSTSGRRRENAPSTTSSEVQFAKN